MPWLCGQIVAKTIAATHDWQEKDWGWSQAGGALLALFALVFAGASWWYSRRSAAAADASAIAAERMAVAAEETAAIARQELDMLKAEAGRRPRLHIALDDSLPRTQRICPYRLYGLELTNDGDADALDTVINVVVRRGVQVMRADDEWGTALANLTMHTTPERDARYAKFNVDVRPHIATRTYIAFSFQAFDLRERGPFSVRVSATHPHADRCLATFEVSRS
jgi:hypothetical protein